ncbi:hypothetical protein EI77_02244 [Prosthecobacter fusiformis]|uniref:Uncharacterized protein n=1 Tax=Prosthecobacter fusiformis TaxID=48464 RepID=A0A4R7S1N8_9BACT|nr:hypothetical protein EI77_02244 [Prosthecobacter fusiformis]
MACFVYINHDTPLLLPPDLRDWQPEGHLVHLQTPAARYPAKTDNREHGNWASKTTDNQRLGERREAPKSTMTYLLLRMSV